MFMMAKEITDEELSSAAAVSVCRPQSPSSSSKQEAVAKLRRGRKGLAARELNQSPTS
jgi:hypothetical protein